MKLVIVESPAKCETIKKYLGSNYIVKASLGHIRDLATSGKGGLGVDVENNFTPTYKISKEKQAVVKELQNYAAKSDEVILATDPDREGEAIAWHLAEVLGLDVHKTKRLEFHEITRESIQKAMECPRNIDMNRVASQETRRILDRIIGFRLSNLIYKKMKSRSAGRVQSAALKLIADHDNEIAKFVPEEYWSINTFTSINNHEFKVTFLGKNGKTLKIRNKKEADEVINNLGDTLLVNKVDSTYKTKESKAPFTTSTLQQEAFARLRFSTSDTQRIAQTLYEGINVGGEHVGLITYMRTDSTRLSASYIGHCKKYIEEKFGKEYLGSVKGGKVAENAQDAHEAIRPTSNYRTPESLKPYLRKDQLALYTLIYNHTIASMMKGRKDEVLTVNMDANSYDFKLEFAKTIFPGYEILYKENDEEENTYRVNFPKFDVNEKFPITKKEAEQKFTQAPAHYSEAKLVKLMEEVGIGRPSTYATTIKTLKERKYVDIAKGIISSTEQGSRTSHVLEKYFPDLVDAKYTAKMEEKLDHVQEGNSSRSETLSKFYQSFDEEMEYAKEHMYDDEPEKTGDLCPECGSPLIYKEGKNGKFIGCSNYPKCKYVVKTVKEVVYVEGKTCPNCGSPLVERKDKKGNTFIACSSYPKCRYIEQEVQVYEEKDYIKDCPECNGHLVKKKGRYGIFLACTNYPTCKHMEKIETKRRKKYYHKGK